MEMKLACAAGLALGAAVATGCGGGDVFRPYGANVPTSSVTAAGVMWGTDARTYRGMNGTRVLFQCPTGGVVGSVYGDGLYTDDSSVCTAGVYAGRISLAAGGPVVIEIRAGAASYGAATHFGVSSNSYAAYEGSYVVL